MGKKSKIQNKKSGEKKPKLDETSLQYWKLVERFKEALLRCVSSIDKSDSELDPKRKFFCDDYFSLLLFYWFNPVLTSMRGLCESTELEKVQATVCPIKIAPSTFSEAQHVFDPELLRMVLGDLVAKKGMSIDDPKIRDAIGDLVAVDGSLFDALPRMTWALYQTGNKKVKLHLKFSVFKETAVDALISDGKLCERKALRKMLKKGECLVADRYYGLEYGFFDELRNNGTHFFFRIRSDAVYDIIETTQLSDEDRSAGVLWDGEVELGGKNGVTVRLVRILAFDGTEILVVTDKKHEDVPAELVSSIYKYRWQIELYFKWLKCLLGSRHLLAESPAGVAIHLYSALIASLLLFEITKKKPTKRQLERIQMYFMGMVTEEELIKGLKLEKSA